MNTVFDSAWWRGQRSRAGGQVVQPVSLLFREVGKAGRGRGGRSGASWRVTLYLEPDVVQRLADRVEGRPWAEIDQQKLAPYLISYLWRPQQAGLHLRHDLELTVARNGALWCEDGGQAAVEREFEFEDLPVGKRKRV